MIIIDYKFIKNTLMIIIINYTFIIVSKTLMIIIIDY